MLTKQAVLVALVGLNLLLLAGVILVGYTPPAAFAQDAAAAAAGEPADIVMGVQAEIGSDATYVIDGQNQLLHAFRTPFPYRYGEPIRVFYVGTRDLSRDFRKEVRR